MVETLIDIEQVVSVVALTAPQISRLRIHINRLTQLQIVPILVLDGRVIWQEL